MFVNISSHNNVSSASQQPNHVDNGTTIESQGRTQRPLSILRIATDLYPDITGGGAIHAHKMSKQQAAHGHSVTVLTSDHGESSRPRIETVDGYTVIRHRELVRPFGNSITPEIVSSLRARVSEADVVHAHSHLYFTSNIAAALKQVSETPLVITNHGLISQTAPKWIQRLFIPTVARFTFNAADHILCYSETDRQRLRDRKIDTKITVIENGINCNQFTPKSGKPHPHRLLFVGRLTDVKGVPMLLEACERLTAQYPDVELRIVGDGPRRSAYEARCQELGINDHVTFIGDVDYQNMATHYQESRLFVLPSRNEGLPRTVLEAMACETPVVTTDLPQLEPIVDGAGVTVTKDSVPDLTDKLSRLLSDEDLCSEFGTTGRQRVLANNSWSETVNRTTDLYYDVV